MRKRHASQYANFGSLRKTGIPTLKAGLEKKIGIIILNLFFLEKS